MSTDTLVKRDTDGNADTGDEAPRLVAVPYANNFPVQFTTHVLECLMKGDRECLAALFHTARRNGLEQMLDQEFNDTTWWSRIETWCIWMTVSSALTACALVIVFCVACDGDVPKRANDPLNCYATRIGGTSLLFSALVFGSAWFVASGWARDERNEHERRKRVKLAREYKYDHAKFCAAFGWTE